ncbi:TetR/AcrR family transcriptional regulator [Agrococcus carbonis]|uniref:DNA-binding transcriptional regulator YbjK n=1 Tax=Agrococcus carbonis TaxID=684552 RepID=A0A1H1Q7Z0_9MICO|nr:TetR/AcrR family transcriptional regulator [Agrococcus carbonis]SDS19510.1 DNA-binding transcriptional regulator YbjK [Agrococcus carbonis]
MSVVDPGSTRGRIVAAGIELLGTEGARALTHRRVDERAGLPQGSTSNHFRSRAALLGGVIDGLVAGELREAEAVHPATAEELVEQLAALVELLTGPMRVTTAARHVLFLEAAHDPALRDRLSRDRRAYVASVVAVLEQLDAADPPAAAEALMALCEGIILHRVARHDETDPRPAIAVAVRGALSAPGDG